MIYLNINATYCIFWNNCIWKSGILFNVMDIVSQLKDKGLPKTIPFCIKKSLLLIYNKIHFNLFDCVIQCHCEMLHHWLNIWMIKYYNEEMWNMVIQQINPNIIYKCINHILIYMNIVIIYISIVQSIMDLKTYNNCTITGRSFQKRENIIQKTSSYIT